MEKIFTQTSTISNKKTKDANNELPSKLVLSTILNYSKALKVQSTNIGKMAFIAN